jgi:hypothetical protein
MSNFKVQSSKEIQITNIKVFILNYFHVPRPAEAALGRVKGHNQKDISLPGSFGVPVPS